MNNHLTQAHMSPFLKRVYSPWFQYFRSRRIRQLYRVCGITTLTRVLDVGGEIEFWQLAVKAGHELPQVTILNRHPSWQPLPAPITWQIGDARNLPAENREFDVVVCNSVIEHITSFDDQAAVASEIARVGKSYFVQTPDPRFPVEPHLLAPFIHWLPRRVQRRLVRNFTLWGLVHRPTPARAEQALSDIRLLRIRQMKKLFPDAIVYAERFLGWPKSIVAIRKPSATVNEAVVTQSQAETISASKSAGIEVSAHVNAGSTT
jgi:hypothetical protein